MRIRRSYTAFAGNKYSYLVIGLNPADIVLCFLDSSEIQATVARWIRDQGKYRHRLMAVVNGIICYACNNGNLSRIKRSKRARTNLSEFIKRVGKDLSYPLCMALLSHSIGIDHQRTEKVS